MNKSQNKIKWYMLSFMCFSTLWAFGNVLNGFIYFNGTQVIFSWILMFALYFVPYALMVGELGSAFKNSGGGVSSWIHETTGAKAAYYAGWTYWACHVTYTVFYRTVFSTRPARHQQFSASLTELPPRLFHHR